MERVNPNFTSSNASSSTINKPLRQDPFRKETLSFDLSPSYPLRIFANRYTPHEPCEDGSTLVLIHAVGMHKVGCCATKHLKQSRLSCAFLLFTGDMGAYARQAL
jgi:hypothetical protein